MSRFEFKKNTVTLDFADGLCYEAEPIKTVQIIEKYTKIFKDLEEKAEKAGFDAAIIEKAIEETKKAINEILEDDSADEKILGSKKDSYYDLIDVWVYICNQTTEFNQSKTGKLNRAQRRSKK